MSTPVHTSTMPRGAGFARPAPANSSARPAPAEITAPGRSSGGSRSGFASLLAAEAIKLKRSSAWVVVILLPLLAVFAGTFNFYANRCSSALWGWHCWPPPYGGWSTGARAGTRCAPLPTLR